MNFDDWAREAGIDPVVGPLEAAVYAACQAAWEASAMHTQMIVAPAMYTAGREAAQREAAAAHEEAEA